MPLPVVVLLISIFTPVLFQIGSLALSPYRIVLLVMVLPCAIKLYMGKAGRVYLADLAILGYGLWVTVCFFVLHEASLALEPSGIMFVESIGAYAMARCYIRTIGDFRKLISLFFWCIAILMPFAVIEAVTGWSIPRHVFAMISPIHASSQIGARWGLIRVQSVFEHPILFGVACGSVLAPVHLVLGYGRSFFGRWSRSVTVGVAAFLAMSSGPLAALTIQVFLLGWNFVLRSFDRRWQILQLLVAAGWITIATLSNRSVPSVLMSYFAFDPSSAYARLQIWEFGSNSVMLHPLFGVGLGSWIRPEWMTSSIDMFWLYHAILFGLPGGIFMMLTYFGTVIPVSRAKIADPVIGLCKTSYVIMMAGFFLAGWTVHFWNGVYVIFLFLLASGVWMRDLEVPGPKPDPRSEKHSARQRIRRIASPSYAFRSRDGG